MIVAARPDRHSARLLTVAADGAMRHAAPRQARDAVRARRSGRCQRRGDLAGKPARHACAERKADRGQACGVDFGRRSDPVHRNRLRRGRSSHAHGGSPRPAAASPGRPPRARAAGRDGRAPCRPSPSCRRCASRAAAPQCLPGWRAMVDRSNIRMSPSRWHCGTSGRRLPPNRSRSSRRRRVLRSTGARWPPGGNATSALLRSRMPPEFRRPEIRRSTSGFPSTSRIASPSERPRPSGGPRHDGGRIIAIGTTVVRAIESAALGRGSVRSGPGIARGRIERGTKL